MAGLRDATAALEAYRLARRRVPHGPVDPASVPASCLARRRHPDATQVWLAVVRAAAPARQVSLTLRRPTRWALGRTETRHWRQKRDQYRGGAIAEQNRGFTDVSAFSRLACFCLARPRRVPGRQTAENHDSAANAADDSTRGGTGCLTHSRFDIAGAAVIRQ